MGGGKSRREGARGWGRGILKGRGEGAGVVRASKRLGRGCALAWERDEERLEVGLTQRTLRLVEAAKTLSAVCRRLLGSGRGARRGAEKRHYRLYRDSRLQVLSPLVSGRGAARGRTGGNHRLGARTVVEAGGGKR